MQVGGQSPPWDPITLEAIVMSLLGKIARMFSRAVACHRSETRATGPRRPNATHQKSNFHKYSLITQTFCPQKLFVNPQNTYQTTRLLAVP